jgi:hypothetical protein
MRGSLWHRVRRGSLGLAIVILIACGDDDPAGPEGAGAATSVVTVQLSLAGDLEPFKVDGRLRAFYMLSSPFIGETTAGMVVLPAGQRTATDEVIVPDQAGTLRLEEITFSPVVPFLCGTSARLDPRIQSTISIVLELCQPCLIDPDAIPDACEN